MKSNVAQNYNTEEIKEKEEKVRVVLNPSPLRAHVITNYTSFAELSVKISKWMSQAFKDVLGALVYIPATCSNINGFSMQNIAQSNINTVCVDITLGDEGEVLEGEGVLKAITRVKNTINSNSGNRTLADAVNIFNANKKARVYMLTEEFKKTIEPYIKRDPKYRKSKGLGQFGEVIWDNVAVEVFVAEHNATRVKIVGLDIYQILKGLYGYKEKETGSVYNYEVLVGAPIFDGSQVPNYHLKINQTTEKIVREIQAKANRCNTFGNINYYSFR